MSSSPSKKGSQVSDPQRTISSPHGTGRKTETHEHSSRASSQPPRSPSSPNKPPSPSSPHIPPRTSSAPAPVKEGRPSRSPNSPSGQGPHPHHASQPNFQHPVSPSSHVNEVRRSERGKSHGSMAMGRPSQHQSVAERASLANSVAGNEPRPTRFRSISYSLRSSKITQSFASQSSFYSRPSTMSHPHHHHQHEHDSHAHHGGHPAGHHHHHHHHHHHDHHAPIIERIPFSPTEMVHESYENYKMAKKRIQELQGMNENNDQIILFFLASKDRMGRVWHNECHIVDRAVTFLTKKVQAGGYMLKIFVGNRRAWMDPENPWRKDPKFNVVSLPTLMVCDSMKRINGKKAYDMQALITLLKD